MVRVSTSKISCVLELKQKMQLDDEVDFSEKTF